MLLVALVLGLVLFLGMGTAAVAANGFPDVPPDNAYHDAISGMQNHGSVAGHSDGTFGPDEPLWRAQFVKMAVETLGIPVDEDMSPPFTDLGPDDPDSLYPHEYVAAAHEAGIVEGVTATTFDPYSEVSRAQAVTMAVRGAKNHFLQTLDTPPAQYMGTLDGFSGVHAMNMRTAEYSGLLCNLEGFGSGWDPMTSATRGEAANVLWNMLTAPDAAVMKQAEGGDVRWILPGPRELDPDVFGTPDMPLGFEDDVGVPLGGRLTTEDESAYTTTADPTPFSDNWESISGSANVRVIDRTAVAGASTDDRVTATFTWTSPGGENTYRAVVTDTLPALEGHENFGGVGLNVVQHGRTGIGSKLMPQVMAYITFWANADLYINGEHQGEHFVHYMLTDRVRDPSGDYSMGFDEDVIKGEVHGHLIMPPPAPSGFTLPNDMEQPFMHIMYEDVDMVKGTLYEEIPMDGMGGMGAMPGM